MNLQPQRAASPKLGKPMVDLAEFWENGLCPEWLKKIWLSAQQTRLNRKQNQLYNLFFFVNPLSQTPQEHPDSDTFIIQYEDGKYRAYESFEKFYQAMLIPKNEAERLRFYLAQMTDYLLAPTKEPKPQYMIFDEILSHSLLSISAKHWPLLINLKFDITPVTHSDIWVDKYSRPTKEKLAEALAMAFPYIDQEKLGETVDLLGHTFYLSCLDGKSTVVQYSQPENPMYLATLTAPNGLVVARSVFYESTNVVIEKMEDEERLLETSSDTINRYFYSIYVLKADVETKPEFQKIGANLEILTDSIYNYMSAVLKKENIHLICKLSLQELGVPLYIQANYHTFEWVRGGQLWCQMVEIPWVDTPDYNIFVRWEDERRQRLVVCDVAQAQYVQHQIFNVDGEGRNLLLPLTAETRTTIMGLKRLQPTYQSVNQLHTQFNHTICNISQYYQSLNLQTPLLLRIDEMYNYSSLDAYQEEMYNQILSIANATEVAQLSMQNNGSSFEYGIGAT